MNKVWILAAVLAFILSQQQLPQLSYDFPLSAFCYETKQALAYLQETIWKETCS